jgi:hypothetical protein
MKGKWNPSNGFETTADMGIFNKEQGRNESPKRSGEFIRRHNDI